MKRLRWSDSIWDRTQTVALWSIGAAASVHELFIRSRPQPEAYPLIAALIGFPFARAFDRARRERTSSSADRDDTDPARSTRSPSATTRRDAPTQDDPGARP